MWHKEYWHFFVPREPCYRENDEKAKYFDKSWHFTSNFVITTYIIHSANLLFHNFSPVLGQHNESELMTLQTILPENADGPFFRLKAFVESSKALHLFDRFSWTLQERQNRLLIIHMIIFCCTPVNFWELYLQIEPKSCNFYNHSEPRCLKIDRFSPSAFEKFQISGKFWPLGRQSVFGTQHYVYFALF